jgi:hypothetical protein
MKEKRSSLDKSREELLMSVCVKKNELKISDLRSEMDKISHSTREGSW